MCFVGNIIVAGGRVKDSCVARVRSGVMKHSELLLIFTSAVFSLSTKGVGCRCQDCCHIWLEDKDSKNVTLRSEQNDVSMIYWNWWCDTEKQETI